MRQDLQKPKCWISGVVLFLTRSFLQFFNPSGIFVVNDKLYTFVLKLLQFGGERSLGYYWRPEHVLSSREIFEHFVSEYLVSFKFAPNLFESFLVGAVKNA